MEIIVSVAKVNRYASLESGDTLEIVERPNGGISIVLSDAMNSGREAKAISTLVVRKVISFLADGVRDGAAARAASDALYTEFSGKSSAYLNILSADLQTHTLVITRNNPTPIFLARGDRVECLPGEAQPIGTDRNIRPLISEIQLQADTTVVMYTDGVANAGSHYHDSMDICALLDDLISEEKPTADSIADRLLMQAVRLDNQHPGDDMSVVVLQIKNARPNQIRRMYVSLPVNESQSYDDNDEAG